MKMKQVDTMQEITTGTTASKLAERELAPLFLHSVLGIASDSTEALYEGSYSYRMPEHDLAQRVVEQRVEALGELAKH